ncbi:MAG: hypothetical protein HDR88_17190 [Bacteroides sp.]|nr:hypothetical protein [Bacteroides sp.]
MNNTLTSNMFSVPLPLRLSGSALKIIAVLSMVADHCAYFLMEPDTPLYNVFRCFGRIAFPVFAFLIAEGFAHTRSRKRYFLSLLGFALISEIPWYLLNGTDGSHNVMFTLLIGVATLAVFDRLCEHCPLCCFSINASSEVLKLCLADKNNPVLSTMKPVPIGVLSTLSKIEKHNCDMLSSSRKVISSTSSSKKSSISSNVIM